MALKIGSILIATCIVLTLGLVTQGKLPFLTNQIESLVWFTRNQFMRFVRPKYFSADPENNTPAPFNEILKNSTPHLDESKNPWQVITSYASESRITYIYPPISFDPTKPSLIFHHGAGQTNPKSNFNLVFDEKFASRFNVFIIHAQHHSTFGDYLNNSVDSFLHHQQTFAGSVLTVEKIIKYHHTQTKTPVVITGSSMGGIVTSLHAFHFGTGDWYLPLVAYPNVGEVFLGPNYKTVVADWTNKRSNPSYLNSFTIDTIDPKLTAKVFPFLGKNDSFIPYERANAFWQNNGFTVRTYPFGHFTPFFARKEIQNLIEDLLKK